ncbi:hypothetical protein RZE82_09425 [Mollicutes bacterium LVI A0039]|nr:hypothetical protein RZE82_09425 [Mollicutes bacterium LVI A0039]
MFLQTKKVVIVYLVTIITFVSISTSLYRKAQDEVTQISVVSSEEFSFNVSFAQNIYNELNIDEQEDQDLVEYVPGLYQLSSNSSVQLSNIVNGSDMTIIVGDNFNQTLEQNIVNNEDKQFVLVENSIDYEYENVYQLNLDYAQMYDAINRNSTDQNQSLLVLTDQFSQLSIDQFYEHEIANNPNVKLEIISNTTDISGLRDVLLIDMNYGFTNVYSLNPYNNGTIIETVDLFNKQSVETANQANSEADSETKSETGSEDKQEKEVVVPEVATFKYISLNQTDYLGQLASDSLEANMYDTSDEIHELIKLSIDDKVKTGDIKVSISDMN